MVAMDFDFKDRGVKTLLLGWFEAQASEWRFGMAICYKSCSVVGHGELPKKFAGMINCKYNVWNIDLQKLHTKNRPSKTLQIFF